MDFKRGDIVVGTFDYDDDELEFSKHDRMKVLEDDDYWIRVKHKTTKEKGWVPKNHVALEGSLESEDWFFGDISEKRTKKLLKSSKNPAGTYLVRTSRSIPSCYTMCIKNKHEEVKNIRIRPYHEHSYFLENNGPSYPSLQELVDDYIDKGKIAKGLKLVKPCPKPDPFIRDLSYPISKEDIWEIPHKDLTFGDVLGRGAFGVVYKGYWKNKTTVAIKKMVTMSVSSVSDFKHEASIMKKLVHTNILPLYGITTGDEIMIITEFMAKGSLLHVLETEGKDLCKCYLYEFGKQIADGMTYLEEKKYVHRDLAARNVLVDDNYDIKISDFGLSRVLNCDVYKSQSGVCPLKWTAPEALDNLFTTKSDVWSYGVVLYEIFSLGKEPYRNLHSCEELKKFFKNRQRLGKPDRATECIYELMLECWRYDKDDRPCFRDIRKDIRNITDSCLCDDSESSSD